MEKLLSLTTQKTLYVEISRARERSELVTDDRDGLRERLEAATGERIAALEAVREERERSPAPDKDMDREAARIGEALDNALPSLDHEMSCEGPGLGF